MGAEFEVNNMDDLCAMMCDNWVPPTEEMRNPFLFDESKSPEGMISVSQIQTFLSCKKKWEYNYIKDIKPRIERSYLTVGKLCHRGMQVAMQAAWGGDEIGWWKDWRDLGISAMEDMWHEYIEETPLLNEEIPAVVQLLEDAKSIFKQAFYEFEPWKYEVLSIDNNGKKSPALELHFWVPCPNTAGMHGFIDAILRDKETGFVWCTDYKFRKSLSPDEDEAFNIQNAVYSYACKKLGVEITGTMTWQHVNTPAADPKINKDGTISTAKIKTTWEHYEKFCQDHGQDPQDYFLEMEEKLRDIEWFRATLEYRNDETVQRMWDECITPVAKRISEARKKNADNYRSMYPWNCKMCQYQSICQGELRGYDVEAIKQREFVVRDR